jgi:hypothetical protein
MIFISSLSHSGSTLLDMILGGHSRFIGLGEIAEAVREERDEEFYNEEWCSCGERMTECDFWEEVVARFASNDKLSYIKKYNTVFDVFEDKYGKRYSPVDSSKYVKHLRTLLNNREQDVKVLYIIKDVRSYTISQIDNAKKKGIYTKKAHNPYKLSWNWYLGNKRIQHFVSKNRLRSLQIGYEELCLYPHMIISKICDFLDVPVEPSMLQLAKSGSHAVLGNRMRTQKKKRTLRYDNRWFYRTEWLPSSFFFPNIMRYNKENVYRNTKGVIWSK